MKKVTLTVLVLFLLAAGGIVWFFQSKTSDVSTPGEQSSIFDLFFPRQAGTGDAGEFTPPVGDTEFPTGEIPQLREVASGPISGAVAFNTTEGVRVRFVDRATGNVYQTRPDSLENTRLTDTLIPRIFEAQWSRLGERVALRYLDEQGETVRTFVAPVASSSTAVSKLSGAFLPDNISDLAFTDVGLLYAIPSSFGISLVSAGFDGSKASTFFTSPIRGWRVAPLGKGALVTTRASAGLNGFAYAIVGSSQTKILGAVSGLATLPNREGTEVLVSNGTREGEVAELASLNVKKQSENILPVRTLVEKCAWATEHTVYCAVPEFFPAGEYPDDWYRGEIHFRDTLWKIDATQGIAEFTASVSALAGRDIDAIHLSVSNNYLVFINKTDGSLWGLTLKSL